MSHVDQHDNDQQRGGDAVSRAYRDARDRDIEGAEPPAALDDAIRAAARRAVHAGPQPVGTSWIRRWTPQLAVAAVVVLSVSVVFVSVEQRPDLAPAAIRNIALHQQAEVPAEVTLPVQAKIIGAAPPANFAADAGKKKSVAEADTSVREAPVERKKDVRVLKEERGASSLAPPPASPIAAAGSVAPASVAPAAAPADANLAPAPFPASVADAIAPTRKEARADARHSATPEPKPLEEKLAVAGTLRAREYIDAPAKPAAPAATTVTPIISVNEPLLKKLAPTATPPARVPIADAARRNTQASSPVDIRAFTTEDFPQSGKADENERPGPWLKRMLLLREQNKLKELREEIARFKKRHPDVVLPKVLMELPAE